MTTKTKSDCTTKGLCHYDSLTKTKFFRGMLLTDEHLRAEQTYHRESLKRLNRHLWGAGVVCGLEVRRTTGLCIQVRPGFALDCDGNAIDVCKCITIDLADVCKKVYPDGCAPDEAKPIKKHLVVRYVEIPADPQPVLTPDDDCAPAGDGGTKCEASKYREGFCLEFRDECPDCPLCEDEEQAGVSGLLPTLFQLATSPAEGDDILEKLEKLKPPCTDAPPCPDCHCEDHAVGLATLTIHCDTNKVEVDCDCRQYVWSPRLIQWLICRLLGNIDKLPKERTGLDQALPAASALARNPLRTAWNVGAIALEERAARLPKDRAPRAKPPSKKDPYAKDQ